MPTFQIVEAIIPAGAGAITISPFPDQATLDIAQIPSILSWFDPTVTPPYVIGAAAAAFRWRDKRFGLEALAPGVNRPAASTINGNPSLSFGADGTGVSNSTNGYVVAPDTSLIGTGSSYSVAFGAEILAAAAGYLLGGTTDTAWWGVSFDSSGRILVHNGNSFIVRPATNYRGQRVVVVVGYSAGTGALTLRINGAVMASVASGAPIPAVRRLRFGGYGPLPAANVAAGVDMRLGQLLTFSRNLTAPGREVQLALVEGSLRTLYNV